MQSQKSRDTRDAANERIRRIQEQIRAMDYVSSGTLVTRTKVCGKPGCRCAHDPAAAPRAMLRVGAHEGRQVHRMLSAEQATVLKKAIANYRAILRLLPAACMGASDATAPWGGNPKKVRITISRGNPRT